MATRGLNWLASRTVLKDKGKDLTATEKEARRLGKPLARAIVRHLDLGPDTTVGEKRDLIRGGLAAGTYTERVVSGRPGGSPSAEGVIDVAFEERASTARDTSAVPLE
jgi:hypothetical protein